jgi:pyruvate kinase
VQPGDFVLIDDGKIRLKVLNSNQIDTVLTEVINGGMVYSNKGVNLPNTKVSIPSLTQKDLEDAAFALEYNVDWIALSFVRKADDIHELRKFIQSKGKDTAIIAKIEKPEALVQLEEIIKVADGIMIARGDLGVELPFSQVPTVQKRIVQLCIEQGKPVIIATQMLESMIQNFRPTRAEANDVANAVTDGADALMLSGETSIGQYPFEAVKSMHEIIEFTEREALTYHFQSLKKNIHRAYTDELCKSAKSISNELQAKGIVCFTSSGYTAYKIACHRPAAPIYVFTQNKSLLRRLNIVWGIQAFYHNFDESTSTTQSMRKAVERLKKENLVVEGDPIIFLASSPLQEKGKTNTIRVERV